MQAIMPLKLVHDKVPSVFERLASESKTADGSKLLRPFQQRVVDAGVQPYTAIYALGGSGKSVLQITLGLLELKSDPQRKQLIIANQSHIGQQFGKAQRIRPFCTLKCFREQGDRLFPICKHEPLVWTLLANNFCQANTTGTIEGLKKFMRQVVRPGKPHGFTAVASHAAFQQAYLELSPRDQKRVASHLTVRLDEAHHAKGVGDLDSNKLGKALDKAVNYGAHLCISTATPYRTEGSTLGAALKDKAKVFNYSLSEWWADSKIHSINISLVQYNDDPLTELYRHLRKYRARQQVIVLPDEQQKWMQQATKEQRVVAVIKTANKACPGKTVTELITHNQHANKAKIINDPAFSDIVIMNKLGREGLDLPEASVLHHTSMEGKARWLALQTICRLTREHENKKSTGISVLYYLPRFKKLSQIKVREDFSDRVNATLLLADLQEDIYFNDMYESPDKGEVNKRKKSTSLSDALLKEVGDDGYAKVQKVKESVLLALALAEDSSRNAMRLEVADILDEYEVYGKWTDRGDLVDGLLAYAARAANRDASGIPTLIDIAWIRKEKNFDLVKHGRHFMFGSCKRRQLQQLRDIYRGSIDWKEFAGEWAAARDRGEV